MATSQTPNPSGLGHMNSQPIKNPNSPLTRVLQVTCPLGRLAITRIRNSDDRCPILEHLITKTSAQEPSTNKHFQNQGGIQVINICMIKISISTLHKKQFKDENKKIRKREIEKTWNKKILNDRSENKQTENRKTCEKLIKNFLKA
jgi:hypothetical protein